MAEYAWPIIGALIFYFYTISCIFFTVRIAALKGRRRGWGWLALFLGLIGLCIVCFLPNAKGVTGETNPIKAAFKKVFGLSPWAAWLTLIGLVVVVGGALIGNRIVLYHENRSYEKELSMEESEKENVMAPAAVYGEIRGIFVGKENNFAITKEGDLYGWGVLPMTSLNEEGCLYQGAAKIATNGETTLLLATDGTLYGKGDNAKGLLLKYDKEKADQFKKLQDDVDDVVMGENVAAMITKRRNLYIWGLNTYHQLGQDRSKVSDLEHRVAANVKKVVVTARSVYYLTEDGTVYGIGSNAYGQFAKGDVKVRKVPAKIAAGCSDLAAGDDFLMILKKDGTVWSAGNDAFGQLGRKTYEELSEEELQELEKGDEESEESKKEEKKEEKEEEPAVEIKKCGVFGQIDLPEGISSIEAAGHTAFAMVEGEVYAWGENHLGQLGTGDRKNCTSPVAVYSGANMISASGECTMILSADGALWGAGDRRDYRLGADSSGNGFKAIAQVKEAK